MLHCDFTSPATVPAPRRPSSVSAALRRVDRDQDRCLPSLKCDEKSLSNYHFRVARDRSSRAKAFGLAKRVYDRCGYSDKSPGPYQISAFDVLEDTFTLLVENRQGRAVATTSLLFDSRHGLPCDEIFEDALRPLRSTGRKVVEVTRLAMEVPPSEAKAMIIRIFNLIYIHARYVKHHDDFVIEVNPRHVGYYDRLLCFEKLSGSRACPRVHGAPAVLLHLDLHHAQKQIQVIRNKGVKKIRNLYGSACTAQVEAQVAAALRAQHRPMSPEEARHFGLAPDFDSCL